MHWDKNNGLLALHYIKNPEIYTDRMRHYIILFRPDGTYSDS